MDATKLDLAKLELDITSSADLVKGLELTHRYKMKAIIVHQDLIGEAILRRNRHGGQFKIIAPIDWPRGQSYGINKLIGTNVNTMGADGFEILLSNLHTPNDIYAEINDLSNFILNNISKFSEVRFVVESSIRTQEQIDRILDACKKIPRPTLIRSDHNTKIQQSKANTDTYIQFVRKVKSTVPASIVKLSGNASFKILEAISSFDTAGIRFAANIVQVDELIKEVHNKQKPQNVQPDQPQLDGPTV